MDDQDYPVALVTPTLREYKWVLPSVRLQHQVALGNTYYIGQEAGSDAPAALLMRLRRDAPRGLNLESVAPSEDVPMTVKIA